MDLEENKDPDPDRINLNPVDPELNPIAPEGPVIPNIPEVVPEPNPELIPEVIPEDPELLEPEPEIIPPEIIEDIEMPGGDQPKYQLRDLPKFGGEKTEDLISDSTGHTCESALFYNLEIAIIKTLCVFTYYATLNPDPVVLDSGSQLLLANMPTPWTFFCTHEDQIPNDIQGAKYALIQKSDLCLCSITAGSLYLHENIGSCADKRNSHVKMNLYFTINQAAYLYFPEMVSDLNLKFDVILNKPRKSTLTNVQLLTAEDTDVVKHKPRPMMLPSAMRSVKQNHTMFNSKGDKALAIDDVSKWITWENKAMSFIFFGSIFSIISLIIILILCIFYYKLKIKFFSTLKDNITTKASKFPRFLTNTFGKFRNSKKGIRPLNKPVKYNVKTRSVTIRPPLPPIPTCSRIDNPMIDTSSLSVQAEINRIETKETSHQLSGMDNLGLDISQIPPPSETE